MRIADLRKEYHSSICKDVLRLKRDKKNNCYPNIADSGNESSRKIAQGLFNRLGCVDNYENISGQTAGDRFEKITKEFLEKAFNLLYHLRPGRWQYSTNTPISYFYQYDHLAYIEKIIDTDSSLLSALGGNYIIKPDIVIGRYPVSDDDINKYSEVLHQSEPLSKLTPLRKNNYENVNLILHASISCKWTIRSDRSQNTRTEALNLIRNRKGPLPHIVSVTAEPLPTRIASLALGTGDLDCVYHFALNELCLIIEEINNQDQMDMLLMMIEGKRLRDISDLPFDLAT
jgi:hypothetical protein